MLLHQCTPQQNEKTPILLHQSGLEQYCFKKKSKLYHILTKNRNKNVSFPQTSTNTKNFVVDKPKTFSAPPKGKWRVQSENIFQNGRTRNLQNEGRKKLRPWRKKKITWVTNNRLLRWRKKKLGGKGKNQT